jgi:hypothetical protein
MCGGVSTNSIVVSPRVSLSPSLTANPRLGIGPWFAFGVNLGCLVQDVPIGRAHHQRCMELVGEILRPTKVIDVSMSNNDIFDSIRIGSRVV